MYCSKCGNKLSEGVKFCQNCGTSVGTVPTQYEPIPNQSVASPPTYRSRGKIVISIVAVVGAMFVGAFAAYMLLSMSGTSIEHTGDIIFESPEEAAQAFASAVASDDFESAVTLFGRGHRAKSLDFADYITRTRTWVPSAVQYPSSNNIFTNTNQQYLRSNASNQISGLVFSLNADEAYLNGTLMQDEGYDTLTAEVTEYCLPENLDTFKILRMDYVMPDTQNTDTSIKNTESLAAIYGGQTIEDYTVLYEYNGKTYFGGMQFIQYDDGWYIYNAYTLLGGQSVQGYLSEMSEPEYIKRVETSDWNIEQERGMKLILTIGIGVIIYRIIIFRNKVAGGTFGAGLREGCKM